METCPLTIPGELDDAVKISIIVETVKTRSITRESVVAHPEFKRILDDFPFAEVVVLEWVWTPLSPYALEQYPDGLTANKTNIEKCKGCDNVLTTMTLHADGNISACRGVGARFIRELTVGNIRKMDLAEADRIARSEERRVGKECRPLCRSRWSSYH